MLTSEKSASRSMMSNAGEDDERNCRNPLILPDICADDDLDSRFRLAIERESRSVEKFKFEKWLTAGYASASKYPFAADMSASRFNRLRADCIIGGISATRYSGVWRVRQAISESPLDE